MIVGYGYQGRAVADLIAFAQDNGLATVVDVRLTPVSRVRGFSKTRLATALAAAGIDYVHLPALGNPRDNRGGFADISGVRGESARERYATEVLDTDGARAAIVRIRGFRDGGVAILCFEDDEAACHRRLVLDAVDASLGAPR